MKRLLTFLISLLLSSNLMAQFRVNPITTNTAPGMTNVILLVTVGSVTNNNVRPVNLASSLTATNYVGNGSGLTNLPVTALQGSGGTGTPSTNGTAGQALLSAGNGGVYWGQSGTTSNLTFYIDYVTNQYAFISNAYITNLYPTTVVNSNLFLTETNAYITNLYVDYITNNYAYFTNLTVKTLNSTTIQNSNVFITETNAYITNLYATLTVNSNMYLTETNAYFTNVNIGKLYVTEFIGTSNQLGSLVVTNGQTNLYMNASQFVVTDANKKLTTTLDGATLTNIHETELNLYGDNYSIVTNGSKYVVYLTNGAVYSDSYNGTFVGDGSGLTNTPIQNYAVYSSLSTNAILTNAISTAGAIATSGTVSGGFTGNGSGITNLPIQNYAVYSSLITNAVITNAIASAGSLSVSNAPVLFPFLTGLQPANAHGSLMLVGDETMDISAAGQSTYLQVTNFDVLVTNLFTGAIAEGVLTNTYAGWYTIRVASSGLGTTANAQLYECGIYTNMVECTLIEWQRSVSSVARGSMASEGTIYLPAGCRVDARVKSDAASPDDITFGRFTLTVTSP